MDRKNQKSRWSTLLGSIAVLAISAFVIYFVFNMFNQNKYTRISSSEMVRYVTDEDDDYDILNAEWQKNGSGISLNVQLYNKTNATTSTYSAEFIEDDWNSQYVYTFVEAVPPADAVTKECNSLGDYIITAVNNNKGKDEFVRCLEYIKKDIDHKLMFHITKINYIISICNKQ